VLAVVGPRLDDCHGGGIIDQDVVVVVLAEVVLVEVTCGCGLVRLLLLGRGQAVGCQGGRVRPGEHDVQCLFSCKSFWNEIELRFEMEKNPSKKKHCHFVAMKKMHNELLPNSGCSQCWPFWLTFGPSSRLYRGLRGLRPKSGPPEEEKGEMKSGLKFFQNSPKDNAY